MEEKTIVDINSENYWEIADRKRNEYIEANRKDMWTRNVVSLLLTIFNRSFTAIVAFPPTLLFCFFLMSSYESGFIETFNSVFANGNVDGMTEKLARNLVSTWIFISALIFSFSFAISPWRSPSERYADYMMAKWHGEYGKKMIPESVEVRNM